MTGAPPEGLAWTMARRRARGARGATGSRQVADDVGVVQVLEHVDLRFQAAHMAHHAPRHRLVLADQHLCAPRSGLGFLLARSRARRAAPRSGEGMGAAAVHAPTGGRLWGALTGAGVAGMQGSPLAQQMCG